MRRGENEKLRLKPSPLDDARTYELLSQGETAGVFQLESSGCAPSCRRLRPSKFEDIIAVVALYCPGPMEQIPVFIESKHGQSLLNICIPIWSRFLKRPYGVIVYQEQIMEVAARMAGVHLRDRLIFRRHI